MKKILWLAASGLMVLSLVLAACAPAAAPTTPVTQTTPVTPTTPAAPSAPTKPAEEKPKQEAVKPSGEVPKYGGMLVLPLGGDITTFDMWGLGSAAPVNLAAERLWDGDWAKGPAGGYGTNEVGFEASVNIRELKAYYLAEKVEWAIDPGGKTGTVKVQVRQGVRWSLNPKSEASRLVNGRPFTTDDMAYNLNKRMNDSRAMAYRFFPWLRGLTVTKTSPSEVSFTFPTGQLLNGIMFLLDGSLLFPPEVLEKYGDDMGKWQHTVGTGPFMVTESIPGSATVVERNANYWLKDQVGPGKGSQLPYLDRVKYIILPDRSTQLAALRTARIDQLGGLTPEEAADMRKRAPALKEAVGGLLSAPLLHMRTDLAKTPYSDVRVRRAMMMATDFNSINKSLYQGLGQILTWPYWFQKGYEGLYLGLDDPQMPASVKELYVYNPDKAKQLLKEAGYPTGFKTSVVMTSGSVDYYSIVKDMWAKVGIEMTFDVKESGPYINIMDNVTYEHMVVGGIPPPASYPEAAGYTGITRSNASRINDPTVNAEVEKVLVLAITDMRGAMAKTKELMKYVLDQAWVIPTPRYPTYTFWWPWVNNYSGEISVGWINSSWPRWLWLDQELKKSMGY